MLHIPQRYYIPERIRDSYRPRLEKSGLWNLPVSEAEAPKPFPREKTASVDEGNQHKETFRRTFETEKVCTSWGISSLN
jgi:sorting and assembly machinery component 37